MMLFKTEDLLKRYGMKAPAFRKLINTHLSKINATGNHATKIANEWNFDEEAVRIIDQIRGIGVAVVENGKDSDRLTELLEENSSLKTSLLKTMAELNSAYKALAENNKLMLEANSAKAIIDEREKEIEALKSALKESEQREREIRAQKEELADKIIQTNTEKFEVMKQYFELRSSYEEEKKKEPKSLLERIFGK